jgi:hypothetical protein
MSAITLRAATRLHALETSEWWDNLPVDQKKQYLEEHPHSKYADQTLHEHEERKAKEGHSEERPATAMTPGSPQRRKMAEGIRKHAPTIAKTLHHTFPRISSAVSALHHLATGKPLDHKHKEVLHELGGIALKTAVSSALGPHAAKAVGQVSVTAVAYGIEKFKEHKEKKKGGDDLETFVEAVADGVEHAEVAKVPKEHAQPKSSYRSAIGQHIKKSASHIVSVIDRSFKDIKPASQGLAAFVQRKPMTDEQQHAMKNLGKFALATSIATLPGGLAAHLAAGAGAAALTHAYKVIRSHEGHGSLVHRLVEAIGEGLEDAIIEEGGGGEGHHGGHG